MRYVAIPALLGLLFAGACQTSAPDPEAEVKVEASMPSIDDRESERRNQVRLDLEKSIDLYWQHHTRQEYGTADGIGVVLERFVRDNRDVVLSDLKAASPRWRKNAAAALGFSTDGAAVPALTDALKDPFQEVVLASLLSLWNFAKRGVDVPTGAVAPYLSHADADIRSNAAMVLAHAASERDGALFLPLTVALEDTDDSVRAHAAAALGSLGDRSAVPFLVQGLKDPKALVRIRCAFALGRLRDERAIPHLIEYIDDPQEDAAKAVHKALTTITRQNIPRDKRAWETYWATRHR